MLTAGDETGRTQGGNNNAYCIDDESSWLSWEHDPWQQDLLAWTRALLALRPRQPGAAARRVLRGPPGARRRHEGPRVVRHRRRGDDARAVVRPRPAGARPLPVRQARGRRLGRSLAAGAAQHRRGRRRRPAARHRRGARRTTCCSTPTLERPAPGPTYQHGTEVALGPHSVRSSPPAAADPSYEGQRPEPGYRRSPESMPADSAGRAARPSSAGVATSRWCGTTRAV